MNSLQLAKILHRSPYTKRNFIGVFSVDKLPIKIKKFPACLVINTDKSGKPGKHWVAMHIKNSWTAEFFDSFGRAPQWEIQKWLLNRMFKNVDWNKVPL